MEDLMNEINYLIDDVNTQVYISEGRKMVLFTCLYGMAKRRVEMKRALLLIILILFGK